MSDFNCNKSTTNPFLNSILVEVCEETFKVYSCPIFIVIVAELEEMLSILREIKIILVSISV